MNNVRKRVDDEFRNKVLKILNEQYGVDPCQDEIVADAICELHKEYEVRMLTGLVNHFYGVEEKE